MNRTLTEIWEQLAASSNTQDGIRRLRIPPKRFKVYAGWSVPIQQPALVLEIPTSSIPVDIEFPQSTGFTVTHAPLAPGRNGIIRITVEAQSDQFSDLFPILIEDVCCFILPAETEEELVRRTLSRLYHWQVFLKRHRHARLSEQEQVGLWGELWFLYSRLTTYLGVEAAVASWQGPDGRNQDFEFSRIAVEIKTTAANPHEKLNISNVRQLEPEGLNALYLYHIALVVHRESGKSLPVLIGEIRDILQVSASTLEHFNEQLFEMGYLDSESSWYEKTGYHVLSQKAYKITDGFPRILSSNIPIGVGDIKYSIVLSACADHLMERDPFISRGDTNE